jgi:hypothetical protein
LSGTPVELPLLCSLRDTTLSGLAGAYDNVSPPVTTCRCRLLEDIPYARVILDVFVGTDAARGGEKEDMEKLCRRKAGEETGGELRGDWAEEVRRTRLARGVCAVLSR